MKFNRSDIFVLHCFMVKVLRDFRVMTVARERSRLVPLKAMATGRPTLLTNAAIELLQ